MKPTPTTISKVMSELAQRRWRKTTKEERSKHASKLGKLSWKAKVAKLDTKAENTR